MASDLSQSENQGALFVTKEHYYIEKPFPQHTPIVTFRYLLRNTSPDFVITKTGSVSPNIWQTTFQNNSGHGKLRQ